MSSRNGGVHKTQNSDHFERILKLMADVTAMGALNMRPTQIKQLLTRGMAEDRKRCWHR